MTHNSLFSIERSETPNLLYPLSERLLEILSTVMERRCVILSECCFLGMIFLRVVNHFNTRRAETVILTANDFSMLTTFFVEELTTSSLVTFHKTISFILCEKISPIITPLHGNSSDFFIYYPKER
jgi:hypothetical protein